MLLRNGTNGILLCLWLSFGLFLSRCSKSSISWRAPFGVASLRKADSRLVASLELWLKMPLRRDLDLDFFEATEPTSLLRLALLSRPLATDFDRLLPD